MQSVILLRRGRVLWGTAMAACLLSGFIVMMSKIPVRALKGDSPAESLRSAVVLPDPNPESPLPNPGSRSAAQPRLVESYGKLPLGFEINKGQTDSRVKFLARGNGYALFLTGDEAVLALKKSGVGSQKSGGPAFGPTHQGSADLGFRSAAFPAWLRSRRLEPNSRTPSWPVKFAGQRHQQQS